MFSLKQCSQHFYALWILYFRIPFKSAEEAKIKRCPVCRVPIERNDGCAQMMCKRCKHVFCWYCLTSLDVCIILVNITLINTKYFLRPVFFIVMQFLPDIQTIFGSLKWFNLFHIVIPISEIKRFVIVCFI